MTVQEAIEHARKVARDKMADADWKWRHGRLNADDCISCAEEHEQLAEWLEELEQYRALGTVEEIKKKIQTELPYMSLAQARFKSELDEYRNLGTVEELKEAREKQVAKKPIGKYTDYKCSVCGRRVRSGKGSSSRQRDNFCQRCGTKIDWEEGAE